MLARLNRTENATAYQTVLRTELEHLKYGVAERRSPLQRGFIAMMILIALVVFGWTIINSIPQQPSLFYWLLTELHLDTTSYFSSGGLNDALLPFKLLFPLCVVIWDFWLMFRTLVMSANSIARERNAKSWELLLLTNATTRQIVVAKWWAVVRRQWRDYAQLAIMRIGAISFLALNFSVNFSFGQFPYFSYGSQGPLTEPYRTTVFLITISIVLLSAAIIAALTMLNLMFTAACGIVGGSISQRAALALPFGVIIRFILIIIVAILAGVPGYLVLKPDIETFAYYPDPVLNTVFLILALVGVSAVDNGSIAAGLLIRFGYNFRWIPKFNGFTFFSDTLRGHGPAFLSALLLSILVYAALTRILLWRAEKINWS